MKLRKKINIKFGLDLRRGNLEKQIHPIYTYVSIGKSRCILSVGYSIHIELWDHENEKVSSEHIDASKINREISKIKLELDDLYFDLTRKLEIVDAGLLKKYFRGEERDFHTLVELTNRHLKMKLLDVGPEFSLGSYKIHIALKPKITTFLDKYYGGDIELRKLNIEFGERFHQFLINHWGLNSNSAMKNMQVLKSYIQTAKKMKWMDFNPLDEFVCKFRYLKVKYLTDSELQAIEKLEIGITRLDKVKDAFLFSCYTGLSFSDISSVKMENIAKVQNRNVIIKARSKTQVESVIPILPQAQKLIEKYNNDPKRLKDNYVLPVHTNQKCNAYLKEIQVLAEITKELTFHMARHTFATTVTLGNNVPIETVSKALGHTKLITTQHYAKVLPNKVLRDFEELEKKFPCN